MPEANFAEISVGLIAWNPALIALVLLLLPVLAVAGVILLGEIQRILFARKANKRRIWWKGRK